MTVINRLPNRETNQRDMLSSKPSLSIAVTISAGRVAAVEVELPIPNMTVAMIPPHALKIAVIISIRLPTASFTTG